MFKRLSSFVKDGRHSLGHLQRLHQSKTPIAFITAHDYPSAKTADGYADAILIGDSLGMVALGYSSTVPVTLNDMIHHTKAVARGSSRAFLVADLPFGSYSTPDCALQSSVRLLQEGGSQAVKLEGGSEVAQQVERLVQCGIPVLGHIGLNPQRVHLHGFKVQGKTLKEAQRLLEDALRLQASGCFGIVIEAVPPQLAQFLTERLAVPTIGIGAGVACSGQVIVQQDILGYTETPPKFARVFSNAAKAASEGVRDYCDAVRSRSFPGPEQSYRAPEGLAEQLHQIN